MKIYSTRVLWCCNSYILYILLKSITNTLIPLTEVWCGLHIFLLVFNKLIHLKLGKNERVHAINELLLFKKGMLIAAMSRAMQLVI